LEGQQGQKLVFEVLAARYGSPLDSILTLYDDGGRIIGTNDDHDGSPDSRLAVTLPKTGVFYLSLADAHDQGGPSVRVPLGHDSGQMSPPLSPAHRMIR
jgi:hypothetical protein